MTPNELPQVDLPPLPKCAVSFHKHGEGEISDYYTADQMREYARTALSTLTAQGGDANASDRSQIADLILTDPQSGAPCFVVSTLRSGPGGFNSFDIQSGPDTAKWRVDVRITECGATEGAAPLVGDGEQHVGACPAVRTAPTRQDQPASTAPKLIGWRSADYTMETSDPKVAQNWACNIDVLPIFEGDVNTKLAAASAQGDGDGAG